MTDRAVRAVSVVGPGGKVTSTSNEKILMQNKDTPAYPHNMGAVAWQDLRTGRNVQDSRLGKLLNTVQQRLNPRLKVQFLRLQRVLRAIPLFDAAYYLRTDPTLVNTGIDPLWHYCSRGAGEGRNPSPYFFTSWYLAQYPQVAESGLNPFLHYLLHGQEQGTNPNPYFCTTWYLERYPQARAQGLHPLLHYLTCGVQENTWPNPYFDSAWYSRSYPESAGTEALAHFLAHGVEFGFQPNPYFDLNWYHEQYPQAREMGLHPLQHYMIYGLTEKIDPHPYFDSAWYGQQYPKSLAAELCPLAHYLEHASSGTVNPNAYFDVAWYRASYPEITKNKIDPVLHYALFGVKERRDPGPYFSTDWYLWKYADVAALAMNPLQHYLRIGAAEGRDPGPFFDSQWYVQQYPETLASGMPPLLHFLRIGQQAGMLPYNPKEITSRGNRYAAWHEIFFGLQDEDRVLMQHHINAFTNKPLISVLMPVYNPNPTFLCAAIESVRAQLYPHWELCIADDASTDKRVIEMLQRYQQQDARIKVVFREENGHISRASNSALALAQGEFVALLDNDDELSEDALFWVVEALQRHPQAGMLYSDEDKIDAQGLRQDPYFKCDWDPFLFWGHNLITHLGVYRRALVEELKGFREGYEGSQDYDLAARAVEGLETWQIVHIPRVLYHWRISAGSTAAGVTEKPYARVAALKVINEHLTRLQVAAQVETVPDKGSVQQVSFYKSSKAPLVSIIIPTRNAAELVRNCVESIVKKTAYTPYEIILVDNGSDEAASLAYFHELSQHGTVRLLRDERPFNYSALNNAAVAAAQGELVVLLNNDTEVIAPYWLHEMVQLALLPTVGAVGAKLVYSNGTLQHAGVVLGMAGGAAHAYMEFPGEALGYYNLALLVRSYSALTAACLAVRKALYLEVGGLDEQHLSIGYNDVDFCLKLREQGYRNVWTPNALLYHHESLSRGVEDTPEKKARFWNELSLLKKRWPNAWYHDPAYNPKLTLSKVDYDRSMQPRLVLNSRHWPEPFVASYVAPQSPGLHLLLALNDTEEGGGEQSRARILDFARELLHKGLISSYAAAHGHAFFEVSPAASGWFDVLCLQGAATNLGWFERALMKYLPYVLDVEETAPFYAAPQLERDNVTYQSLVHATVISATDAQKIAQLEELYGLHLAGCSQVLAGRPGESSAASLAFLDCLLRARLAEPLPACRIRFF